MARFGFILLSLLAVACNDFREAVKEARKEIPPPPKDNYIVLLDLSDRILKDNQHQVAKDLTIIKTIYALFKSNLNRKDPSHLYYALNDKLKVLIAPQKTTPGKLYEEAGLLRVELSSEQPEKKAKLVDETEKTFNMVLPDVYRQALVSKNSSGYTGADIWKYFNEDLADDLDKDSQNTLFIVTDGYLDFEKTEERPVLNNRFTSCARIINSLKNYPDWNLRFEKENYGLMPVSKKFPKLKVVLLQINPGQEWPGEYTLLTRIWGKWFTEMSIDSFRFIKNDNSNEVKESIEKFMQLKLTGKIEPVQWTAIPINDSNVVAIKTSRALAKQNDPSGSISAGPAFKKKDEFAVLDPTNIGDKIARRTPTVKRLIKQKEQVSFGPAY